MRLNCNFYTAASGCELEGITLQVEDNLLQPLHVSAHHIVITEATIHDFKPNSVKPSFLGLNIHDFIDRFSYVKHVSFYPKFV